MVAKKKPAAPTAPRTVSEIAAATRQRKASVEAGMADPVGHGKTSPLTEMQGRIKGYERQVSDLIQTNAALRAEVSAWQDTHAHEARERRKLTEEVTAIASSLGRCGDGELVISRMLFGAVRFHGSSSPMVAAVPEPAPDQREVWMAYRAKTEG